VVEVEEQETLVVAVVAEAQAGIVLLQINLFF
jgi:hypothetical protein